MKRKSPLTERTYTGHDNIPRVVLVPESETDVSTGIPVSLDLSALYGHMGAEFQSRLYIALHARGLVKPIDYFKPGAADNFRAALLSVIRADFLSAQTLAKQELS